MRYIAVNEAVGNEAADPPKSVPLLLLILDNYLSSITSFIDILVQHTHTHLIMPM